MHLPKRATLSVGLLLLVLYCVIMVSQLQRNAAKEETNINELGGVAPNDGDGPITVEKAAWNFKKKIKRRGSEVIEYESRPRPAVLQVKPRGKLPDPATAASVKREVLITPPSQKPPSNPILQVKVEDIKPPDPAMAESVKEAISAALPSQKPSRKLRPSPPKDVEPGQTKADKKIRSSIAISSMLSLQNLTSFQQAKVKSSVDYHACCGLGHRMSKMVDANYVAKKKNLGLRISWGHCNATDIFQHFFGPQPLSDLANVTSTGLYLKINNDAGGFRKLIRDGNATDCKCPKDVIEEHNKFYESLRQRFRLKKKVKAFQKQYLANHTVLGIHVRAGNGEEGDFVRKGRGINNTDSWIKSVSRNLIDIARDFPKPPRLFIATDTPYIITAFREELKEKMAVVDYEQDRAEEGKGVLFGVAGKIERNSQCLGGWEGALMDMMILSYSDVVVAGRPSSFTQSLPITVALAKPKGTRAVPKSFCELNPAGTKTWCYTDFEEWCCRGRTDFHLEGIRRYEFRRMPVELEKQEFPVSRRLPLSKACPAFKCGLPYDWLRK